MQDNSLLPVTVVIPVKNEEVNLALCLEHLGKFSEIIVIDSGSTDQTLEIARASGASVVQFKWNGQYPKKRNWLLLNDPPSQPWVLFLDADEFIDTEFCNELKTILPQTKYDGFWLNFTNTFLGKKLRHGIPQRKLALFRVGRALYERIEEDGWSGLDMEIHEHPIVSGDVGEISVSIEHCDFKGLANFISKHRDYAQWEAKRYSLLKDTPDAWLNFTDRQRFKYRHLASWWYPWFYFLFTYVIKQGFRDGGPGFYYAFYKAWYFQTIRLLIKEAA